MENVLNIIFLGKRIGRTIVRTVVNTIGGVFKMVVYAIAYLYFHLLYFMARPYYMNRPYYRRYRRFSTTAFMGLVRDPQELSEVESAFDMDLMAPVHVIFGGNHVEEDDESDSIETIGGSTDSSEERRQLCGDDDHTPPFRFVSTLEEDEELSTCYSDND